MLFCAAAGPTDHSGAAAGQVFPCDSVAQYLAIVCGGDNTAAGLSNFSGTSRAAPGWRCRGGMGAAGDISTIAIGSSNGGVLGGFVDERAADLLKPLGAAAFAASAADTSCATSCSLGSITAAASHHGARCIQHGAYFRPAISLASNGTAASRTTAA